MLSEDNLNDFCKNGYVVIENVLTPNEVSFIRTQFHQQLASYGINHDKLLSGEDIMTDEPRIKGKPSHIFYNKWKIDAQINEKVYGIVKELLVNTFGKKIEHFNHPFGYFTDVVPYIDRVCYRLPDHIRAEGGLKPHIDRNPNDPYLEKSGGLKRWRPVQGLLTLTDHYGSSSGGIKVVKEFHKIDTEYFSKIPENQKKETGGEFHRLNPNTHAKMINQLEAINAPCGSLVLWDNRLPHSTCETLLSADTREVIYMTYMPNIELNQEYFQRQSDSIKRNIAPPMYTTNNKDANNKDICVDRNWEIDDLTSFQQKLLLSA